MNQGVNIQEAAKPETVEKTSEKEFNFRRLEAQRDAEREARMRAEAEAKVMREEMQQIKTMLMPQEKDPLDDDSEYVAPQVLKAKLEKERAAFEKRAEEIANRIYEKRRQEELQNNYLDRLKMEHPDYDAVMNEDNILKLEQVNPTFLRAVTAIPDEYQKRKLAYEYLSQIRKQPEAPSITERVAANARNPFMLPSGSGTPPAVNYDLGTVQGRQDAYNRLKAAQKQNGQPAM